ncbi:MAG: Bacterial extracellular solute-binding protein [candidate division WS6 bacterium OLB20]|uniref:Bacterial extracellular solute-binding protein n=1 Tax=candidate division WS6 bacterium OLB20 TaxID=1617426 RepID=A0A136LXW2_9BACT|nr:MAG: Bacterial extracellular solute-binding protein [candidate division WS6 bacterium OLB20]
MKQLLSKYTATAVVLAVTLAACTGGGNQQVNPTPTPGGSTEETILIWWNLFEPEENVRPLIDAYENLHPNVTIQYDQRGVRNGVEGYRSELDVVLNDNNALSTPDIFTVHNSWMTVYEKYVSPAPSNTFTPADLQDFYPVVTSDFAYNDRLLAIPVYMDALAIIYNKAKLQEALYTFPSDDWLEFSTQAKNLTRRDANNRIISSGFSAVFPNNTEFNFDMFNLLLLQNGVQMTNGAGTATFASDAQIGKADEALTFYRSFVGSAGVWTEDQKIDIASFLEKKLAMYAAPSWRLIDVLEYNEEYNLGIDVGVAPVPQLGSINNDEEIYWPTYWGQTVSKESSNTAVAWDFLQFITQAEQLKTLDQTVKANGRPIGILYPRISMAGEITNDPEANELLGPYMQALANSRNWRIPDGDRVKAAFDQVLLGDQDLNNAQETVTNLYKPQEEEE